MKFFRSIPIVLLVICINSCDRKSCETDNPIFLNHSINDQDYKIELAKQIESIGQQNLRYWLHDYVNQDESEYLQFYVQNDDSNVIFLLLECLKQKHCIGCFCCQT